MTPLELSLHAERYAVYRCYSDGGILLYVGHTARGGKRLGEHADKAWFLQVRGITLEWYADELDARNAERRAIHVEHPKYNIQHRNGELRTAKEFQGNSRRSSPAPRTASPTNPLADQILACEPEISGAELGRRLGVSQSYACRLKRLRAASIAGADRQAGL